MRSFGKWMLMKAYSHTFLLPAVWILSIFLVLFAAAAEVMAGQSALLSTISVIGILAATRLALEIVASVFDVRDSLHRLEGLLKERKDVVCGSQDA